MKRWYREVWNERKIETIRELLSPEFVGHYEHEEIKGINNWKERFFDTLVEAIPDFHVEIDDMLAHGDQVVARWKVRGVFKGKLFGMPPTGETIEFVGSSWTRVVDGKLIENWNYWNMSYLIGNVVSEVRTLRGILPLCMYCKKVRDDEGYWERVDTYIRKHSTVDISHGICPECLRERHPEV
jgi:steroid delta-isomerase-like uncharacterized protein